MPIVGSSLPVLAAGAAMVALSLWLLWLGPASRVHRAFSLLLAIRGTAAVLFAFSEWPLDVAGRFRQYFLLALPFAAAYFALIVWLYRVSGRGASPLRSPVVTGIFMAAALGVEALYWVDHGLYLSPEGELGPLFVVPTATVAINAALAAVLIGSSPRVAEPLQRRAFFAVGMAFWLEAAYTSAVGAVTFATSPVALRGTDKVEAALVAVAFGLVLLAPVVVAFRGMTQGAAATTRPLVSALAVGGIFVLGAVTLSEGVEMRASYEAIRFVKGTIAATVHLMAVVLAAVAILRYRFLDLDTRVRWTISRGFVASAFVAAFFVGTEGVAAVIARASNPLFGIVATGLLILALAPLRRLGDRIAGLAMPDALPVEARTMDERAALFAEQTRIAWEDGVLTMKERRMLDMTRERLGLSETQAARLERHVLDEQHPARPPRRRARPVPVRA